MVGRALVTGVSGQDGSYLVERLLAGGWQVDGLVRSADEAEVVAAGVTVHVGDLAEPDTFARLLPDVVPDVVVHLAGISSVAQSWQEPELTAEVTAAAVARLLAACFADGRDPHVLLASSAEVFGGGDVHPQSEATPVRPASPYGAAKAYALHLGGVYRGAGHHVSSAILYNHESPRRPPTFVTRKITSGAVAIAEGRERELRLGNLAAVRDWGWAPDYVDAMLRMVLADEAADHVVATGRGRTVEEFVAAAFAAAGVEDWRRHVVVDERFFRPVDSVPLVGDPSAIRERLGWEPTVGFEEMVRRMVDVDRAPRAGEAGPESGR